MNKVTEFDMIAELQFMNEADSIAQSIFAWMASKANNATETNVSRASDMTGQSYGEVVRVFKELDKIGCGKFVTGRKGYKSRMVWEYSTKSIGEVARGEAEDMEEIQDLVLGKAAEDMDESDLETPLTIPQAKARLAYTLGISPDAIEINIKA